MNDQTKPQPPPEKNDRPAAWDLVVQDMRDRDVFGKAKYGTRLQPFNGRDQLVDAYQEVLDLAVYLRNAIYERDHSEESALLKQNRELVERVEELTRENRTLVDRVAALSDYAITRR